MVAAASPRRPEPRPCYGLTMTDATVAQVWRGESAAQPLEFRRGWLLGGSLPDIPVAREWRRGDLGSFEFAAHPSLSGALLESRVSTMLLLGTAVDMVDGEIDGLRVLERLQDTLLRSGLMAMVEQVAYLGGRFVLAFASGGDLRVIPDCAASMSSFWAVRDGTPIISSHTHLLAEAVPTGVNEQARRFLQEAKNTGVKGTIYLPGTLTPFEGQSPLIANHLLEVIGSTVRHRRFYPFSESMSVDRSVVDPFASFERDFSLHVAALSGLLRPGVSLTSGLDSQATFAAMTSEIGTEFLTWTYYNFDDPHDGMRRDLLEANALARRHGVAHQIVALGKTAPNAFSAAYRKTMLHGQQFRAVAQAYFDQLPPDITEFQSMVAEVGTGFYKRRHASFSIERLSELYNPSLSGHAILKATLQDFVDYAEFEPSVFGLVDFHDLFYWESRIGRWGALRMQEVDLAHQLVLPFNARSIVESLMAISKTDGMTKSALRKYASARLHPG